ncbi:hypothetical protein G5645_02620 [Pectobacterium carotovorum]|uniref:hypothetical protein n=1 Tax=Pectobacterium carotovorum TaxID=554 RepID=UPI00191F76EE|nr:hypothetical protein [Pectobacterium carotovorum]MBL0906877.1 hypothetical protein [Pectobacterium carotovorum]
MKPVTSEDKRKQAISAIMEEFIDACDAYLFCLSFSVVGIEDKGKELKKMRFSKGQRLWLGSDLETDQKMHARMDIKELVNRCGKNGLFTTELTKALLGMIYSVWDEFYRHKIAEAYGCEPDEVFCPLMGDLRKIRHCIMHHKSIVNDNGLKFEYLNWVFHPGPLIITYEMFRELNDAIRGKGMKIKACILAPEIKCILPLMSNKERKSFDEFYRKFENKMKENIWPGMQNFLKKNKGKPGIKELADLYTAKEL